MKRKITTLIAAAAAPLALALVAAGCGSSASGSPYSSGPYGSAATPNATPAGAGAKVGVRNAPLGRILVDGRGRTLYLFEKDKSTPSTCYGTCASIWPPFTSKGKPRAGHGVLARKLGRTKRTDGKLEVTYNRHPLYYYSGDTKPGETNGQGLDQFGAEWSVLSPAGTKVERDGS